MSNCGLPCPVYLVEKFGDASHFSIPERSLKQAIANTQVGGHVGVANTQVGGHVGVANTQVGVQVGVAEVVEQRTGDWL